MAAEPLRVMTSLVSCAVAISIYAHTGVQQIQSLSAKLTNSSLTKQQNACAESLKAMARIEMIRWDTKPKCRAPKLPSNSPKINQGLGVFKSGPANVASCHWLLLRPIATVLFAIS